MTSIRPPAVAGLFYPENAAELRHMIEHLLAAERAVPTAAPKAIIAPHAGYIYSGPVAASAYRRLITAHDKIHRVWLLGPSHRVPLLGLAASSADYFTTPLGNVRVDHDAINQLLRLPQVHLIDEAHTLEHSLEVHLPFLQMVLDSFSLVPLVVGDATPAEVAEVLDTFWKDDETLLVISSDLSHYHSYEMALRMDRATSRAIESLSPEAIDQEDACGRVPILGLLELARRHGLQATTIDLRNSGDTAGPRDQVVGYGAYVFDCPH